MFSVSQERHASLCSQLTAPETHAARHRFARRAHEALEEGDHCQCNHVLRKRKSCPGILVALEIRTWVINRRSQLGTAAELREPIGVFLLFAIRFADAFPQAGSPPGVVSGQKQVTVTCDPIDSM